MRVMGAVFTPLCSRPRVHHVASCVARLARGALAAAHAASLGGSVTQSTRPHVRGATRGLEEAQYAPLACHPHARFFAHALLSPRFAAAEVPALEVMDTTELDSLVDLSSKERERLTEIAAGTYDAAQKKIAADATAAGLPLNGPTGACLLSPTIGQERIELFGQVDANARELAAELPLVARQDAGRVQEDLWA